MDILEHLRINQARVYFRMQEHRDRYEFLCNFIVTRDLSHDDLLTIVNHQIKFERYHLEAFEALLEVLVSDKSMMDAFRKGFPEVYPSDCKEVYFKLHNAYKEEQAAKKIAQYKKWAENRERMFKNSRPKDTEEDDGEDDPPFM